jgi:hypothetical protein
MVPIVDGVGATLERRPTVVRMPHGLPVDSTERRAVLTAAGVVAARRLGARVRRLRRMLVASVERAMATEEHVARRMRAEHSPPEVQPGLFSRRDLGAFTRKRETAAALDRAARAAGANLERAATLDVGAPVLALVVTDP